MVVLLPQPMQFPTIVRNTAFTDNLILLRNEMSEQLQVRQRGTLTIPASLRDKYDIKTGDMYQLVDLDGVFVLTPMVPMVPELAREIERMRQEAGLSMEELLRELREDREQAYRQQHGNE
jgi:bifunctional DNA-binding transcriptional regulator/antitoxin component of YhaV-PrlF toxin-antitoxin module